jgi:hypothetical protein
MKREIFQNSYYASKGGMSIRQGDSIRLLVFKEELDPEKKKSHKYSNTDKVEIKLSTKEAMLIASYAKRVADKFKDAQINNIDLKANSKKFINLRSFLHQFDNGQEKTSKSVSISCSGDYKYFAISVTDNNTKDVYRTYISEDNCDELSKFLEDAVSRQFLINCIYRPKEEYKRSETFQPVF